MTKPLASRAPGRLLVDRMAHAIESPAQADRFVDIHSFPDEVHGDIQVNDLERDIIDTPEFQRLFRVSQLGFIDLAYPSANHTRGVHSIGVCHLAKRLTQSAPANTSRVATMAKRAGKKRLQHPITHSEEVLISLGALLHDISHGPFSHEIEKKTHWISPAGGRQKIRSHYGPYPKHDDFDSNPALQVFLFDTNRSVLARVLRSYSPRFWRNMRTEKEAHISHFVQLAEATTWPELEVQILPSLLFHLLAFEKPDEAFNKWSLSVSRTFDSASTAWGIGPQPSAWEELHKAWYQPYRHDIIGDTLSADLIDYLLRDCRRLSIARQPDLHVLNYYVLVPWAPTGPDAFQLKSPDDSNSPDLFRCAIDLTDYKRGSVRVERMNEVFRLLDLRNEIHEKAVYHRVVQSALAMMCRAVYMMDDSDRPAPEWFYGLQKQQTSSLAGDDAFLQKLVETAAGGNIGSKQGGVAAAQSIAQKLAERRVYRPLVVIPGDKIPTLLQGAGQKILLPDGKEDRENVLREFAAVVDSTYYSRFFLFVSWCIEKLLEHSLSEDKLEEFILRTAASPRLLGWAGLKAPKRVIFWVTPYKQLYKDPAILVCMHDDVCTIENLSRRGDTQSLAARAKAGIADSETKYENLWKLHVFLSDGLYHTGTLAKLLKDHPCASATTHHIVHLHKGQEIVIRALREAWEHWTTRRTTLNLSGPESMLDEDLGKLLRLLARDADRLAQSFPNIATDVPGVFVQHYLHGDQPDAACRDIRYKYDRHPDPSVEEFITQEHVDPATAGLLRDVVGASQFAKKRFSFEELCDLTSRLSAISAVAATQFVYQLQAQRSGRLVPDELLRALWRQEPDWETDPVNIGGA